MDNVMQQRIGGLHIGVMVGDGFEQVDLTAPRKALEEMGAVVRILSSQRGKVQGMHRDQPGDSFDVDLSFDAARADDFAALLLPGGSASAESLRSDPEAHRLVRDIDRDEKPVGAIGQGVMLLVAAGLAQGRKLTGSPDAGAEVRQAGGKWVEQKAVADRHWVSARASHDLPAFIAQFKQLLARHVKQSVQGTADDLPGAAATGG